MSTIIMKGMTRNRMGRTLFQSHMHPFCIFNLYDNLSIIQYISLNTYFNDILIHDYNTLQGGQLSIFQSRMQPLLIIDDSHSFIQDIYLLIFTH